MRLGPQLLITMLLVAGGIFIYDATRSGAPAAGTGSGYELRPDGTGEAGEPAAEPTGGSETLLDGGAETMLARNNAGRIARLERSLTTLEEALARLRRAPKSGAGAEAIDGGESVPALDPRDIVNEENPHFDDATLATISAYFDEIHRRRSEERERMRIGIELDRQGVDLSETQKKAVINETVDYQERMRALLGRPYPPDEAGRTERQEALNDLKGDYEKTIRRIVPDEEKAQKVLESRTARRLGFTGGLPGGRVRNRR
jgi:hypothetical protein